VIAIGGAYLEPKAYLLLDALLTAMYEHDMDDMVEVMRARLFRSERVLYRDTTGRLAVWRLSDWGELVLCEIFDIVRRAQWTPGMRRHAIDNALAFAGVEPRRPS
jgi:hypothetical protein